MRRVLDRVQADETHALPQEVVGAQPHREQVVVPRVPADGGHVLLTLLLVGEAPDRQLVPLVLHRVEGLAVRPVVLSLDPHLVVVVLLLLVVLHHHTLHDLQLLLETRRVQSSGLDLVYLRAFLPCSLLRLHLMHVGIKNLPLVDFQR